ncbi:glutathione peroxidase [Gammaproteobacteria bacterium]|nr:glutathione peroxidase [Gammaproteobacteria bacterium]MDA8856334.1 glutathione peroxidase [Gammaproteobacteria bacterium]MDA9038409.1 glutathione peroxidase [Gammaproteobacteria bacterium]MDA9044558.1 glutathione peroxidase [Gammaproteobacteria bacterium]MDA9195915.1 glutathione peroxidase [Gammaproteobacteria bacterium]|tara:strand:+ start:1676 stop:2155 length:480 start_codon:yes stop_codon:yes gene_type:complete
MKKITDFVVKDNNLDAVDLSIYDGKTLLIVNVASECGLTYHYEGLQELYNEFNSHGLEILAFPSNQFGAQEPGSNDEIKFFCTEKYNVTFPLFNKIDVNGPNEDPLYTFLKHISSEKSNTKDIEWNFTKFLFNKNSDLYKRYDPRVEPSDLIKDIQSIL